MLTILAVLENDGFGARPFFEAFVAVDSEYSQLVGYVLYFYSYSTWQGKSLYMEDIYVQPEHRKKRIGLTMLRHVAQVRFLYIGFYLRWYI